MPRTAVPTFSREPHASRPGATADVWTCTLADTRTGETRTVNARAVVNAAGPWVTEVLTGVAGINSQRTIRLVKGSHIVTPKFWDGTQAYLLQNSDKRVIFVNPYEDGLALIGTTDIAVDGDPGAVAIDDDEIDYLIVGAEPLFRQRPDPRRHRAQLLRCPAAL